MPRRILLVRPPSGGVGRPVWLQPPMNLHYLASFLNSLDGVSARVEDFAFSEYSREGFSSLLDEFPADFVGVAPSQGTLSLSSEMFSIARSFGAKTVAGGAYSSMETKKVFLETGADACVLGEAEIPLGRILRFGGLRGAGIALPGKPLPKIPLPPKSLDRFGWPDRRRKEFRKYDSCSSAGIGRKTAFVTASRGCPYRCTFCVSPEIHGHSWRARTVGNVLDEIENCVRAGYRHVQFDDDIFGLEGRWFADFCGGMVGRGLAEKISWDFATRADLVDRRLLALAKSSGARKICIGVESGSGKILSSVKKGVGRAEIVRAFSLAREEGLLTQAFIVLGLFGETKGTLLETEKLLLEIDPDIPAIMLFSPMRGTVEWARFGGPKSPPTGFFSRDALKTGGVSPDRLVSFRDSLYRKLCLRPSYVLRRLSSIRDFGEFAYNARAALSVVSGRFD